jgi:XTP/dITP diphosphohydrolase
MSYASSLTRLRHILDELRTRCPWDKKQTVHTLRQLTLEETYELAGAITAEDWQGMKEELGDLLLHILFYARIGAEQGQFTLEDVIEGVCNKLVGRHPHIYGSVVADTDDAVKQNWEAIKMKEGKKSILSGVPVALPSLIKALRLQDKAKSVGFEWEKTEEVRAKVDEELQELTEAVQSGEQEKIEDEYGDVLFALVNYARFLHLDPDAALEKTNIKFKRRFEGMERMADEEGITLHGMSLADMDTLWNRAKSEERGAQPSTVPSSE